MTEPKFLNYADAARYLSVPVGTLRALVHRKTIPHVRIGPRSVTFDRAELDRWVTDKQVSKATKEPAPLGYGHTSEAHEQAIRRLAPDAERTRFPQRLLECTGMSIAHVEHIIPDAFAIDDAARCVLIYEVEHSHPLTNRKMSKLRSLHDRLAAIGWSLRLFAASSSCLSWTELDVENDQIHPDEGVRIGTSPRGQVRFEMPGVNRG